MDPEKCLTLRVVLEYINIAIAISDNDEQFVVIGKEISRHHLKVVQVLCKEAHFVRLLLNTEID